MTRVNPSLSSLSRRRSHILGLEFWGCHFIGALSECVCIQSKAKAKQQTPWDSNDVNGFSLCQKQVVQ